jgi:regulator of replication initiation timing
MCEVKGGLEAKLEDYSQALADIKGMNEAILSKARDADKEVVKLKVFAEDLVRKNAGLEADTAFLRAELAATKDRMATAEQKSGEFDDEGARAASESQLKHLIQVGFRILS